ncbi:probable WRKY transcription factor 75 [Phoenix dactylifera]|uniref:Probable WRKY transcription factor 75 n=1 Tax=Phoenix dactylifera TaxID=42345 RepID=A0A8B7BKD9_PHODC|nr:probable WRKY transcription factor 75 [Phoenix dactylifera]
MEEYGVPIPLQPSSSHLTLFSANTFTPQPVSTKHHTNNSSGLLGWNETAKAQVLDDHGVPRREILIGSEAERKPATKKREKKVRTPRYAFQTRSQVDILDDGYRWRKYGQKAVKNNKFSRSYYRCTYQGCNVKKQVQRLSKDEGIVVTTYEGMHTHLVGKSNDNFERILNQLQVYSSF